MADLHATPGPVLFTHAATHLLLHATEGQYPTIRAAIDAVAEIITSHDSFPCPWLDATGCRWWAFILTGDVDPAEISDVYRAAIAANN